MRFSLILFLLTFALCGCNSTTPDASGNKYMDLKGYFDSEVSRLQKSKAVIDKKVTRNSVSEVKRNTQVNWDSELALFADSDINKPGWRNSYKVTSGQGILIYRAIDPSLKTKYVEIRKDVNGKVIYISIRNRTKNNLYESIESLTYIPDSVYTIQKSQKVLLLGHNTYLITGKSIH